jgi:hypothetical protein
MTRNKSKADEKSGYSRIPYNQRNKDESIMSVVKRLFGECIKSTLVRSQNRELSFRLINEIDFLNDKISKLQKTSYSLQQQQSSKMKEEDQEIQKELTDQKEIMKILAVSIVNYMQAFVDICKKIQYDFLLLLLLAKLAF